MNDTAHRTRNCSTEKASQGSGLSVAVSSVVLVMNGTPLYSTSPDKGPQEEIKPMEQSVMPQAPSLTIGEGLDMQ